VDSRATVQAVMDSLQKGDFDKAKAMLSADFQFSGPTPEPMNGEAWMAMSRNLLKAFPNLDYQFRMEIMEGDTASISAQLKGTHSADFDLTGLKMGVIPATNKSFSTAKAHGKVTVKGDKVTSRTAEPTEGAGLMAILGQLGIKPPSK